MVSLIHANFSESLSLSDVDDKDFTKTSEMESFNEIESYRYSRAYYGNG